MNNIKIEWSHWRAENIPEEVKKLDIVELSKIYDVMIVNRGEYIIIFLDKKGWMFKQR